ncbi:MAG: hypothetical protein HYZ53_13610 [Planctomycetes bacterium]|nr:hypothetical protein [Planctomycetota bacterium]
MSFAMSHRRYLVAAAPVLLGTLVVAALAGRARAQEPAVPAPQHRPGLPGLAERLDQLTCDRSQVYARLDSGADVAFADVIRALDAARSARFERVEFAAPWPGPPNRDSGPASAPPAAWAVAGDLELPIAEVAFVLDGSAEPGAPAIVLAVDRDGCARTERGKTLSVAGDLKHFLDEAEPRLDKSFPHPRDRAVRIRADRRAPWGAIQHVMDACAGSYLWNLSFAAWDPSGAIGRMPAPLPLDKGLGCDDACTLTETELPTIWLRVAGKGCEWKVTANGASLCAKHGISSTERPELIRNAPKPSNREGVPGVSLPDAELNRVHAPGSIDRAIREAGRRRADPATHAAVDSALCWLARHQGRDGAWRGKRFPEQCAGEPCAGAGVADHDVGLTSLALLAFLGAGYSHLSSERYEDAVTARTMRRSDAPKNAILFLLQHQDHAGRVGEGDSAGSLYDQAVATAALAEAYGVTQSPLFKEPAEAAVKFLLAAQNPGAAWRYTPRAGDNDVSVTGWCLLALVAAEAAGLDVPAEAKRGALDFIRTATEPNTGRCGYRSAQDIDVETVIPGGNEEPVHHLTMTAVGMVCRMFGERNPDDPVLDLGAKALDRDRPSSQGEPTGKDYNYWFWGTLALFHTDGPARTRPSGAWTAWDRALSAALIDPHALQSKSCDAGSWAPDDRWGCVGGRVYSTALNCLSLEASYRYGDPLRPCPPK